MKNRMLQRTLLLAISLLTSPGIVAGEEPRQHALAAEGVTSLTNPAVRYRVPAEHYVVLKWGPVSAILADNAAIDVPELPGHKGRYNGLASLTHEKQPRNIFVPTYAGLNLEHIHDGTTRVNQKLFEPREVPMELRIVDDQTVEVYQGPTPMWKLESCGRYHLLEDGTVEYTFECIPHEELFSQGFIGLFWASYIQTPREPGIHFLARNKEEITGEEWVYSISPKHGVEGTHPPAPPRPEVKLDPDSRLVLGDGYSKYVHTANWYYGVSHGMAYVAMFRPRDKVWIVQSPSGGGQDCPAWDFQWFIPNYKVGEAYGLTMRLAYVPYESREQVIRDTQAHRNALGHGEVVTK